VVVGLEQNAELAARAGEILADLEIENGAVIEGKLTEGCSRQGPYQVILIAGAVEEIPGNILDQLAEGGRLVTVLIKGSVGRGHLILRKGNIFSGHDHFDANLPLLPGFEKEKKFSF
jgi:protein-L-isoaspartate(D-aspartate) O-methyltransferase